MILPAFVLRRRRIGLLAILASAGFAAHARADDPLPKPVPLDRYSKMAAHSPFSPSSEAPKAQVPATPPPQASAFEKLTATMLMQVDGVYSATVLDPDSPDHLYLSSNAVDEKSQLKIASVKWDPANNQDEPVITLSKGTQFGQVRYEPTAGGGMTVPPRAPGMVSAAGNNNNNLRPNLPPPSIPGAVNLPAPIMTPNTLRRAPIRAIPAPGPGPGGAGRPVVLPGAARAQPARSGPQVKTDDDDDDDD